MDTRIQFSAKPLGKTWGVYDRFLGSWPIRRPDLGPVAQDHRTEAAAQLEADRCNKVVAQ